MTTQEKLNNVLGYLTAMSFDKPELSNDLVEPLNTLSEAISEVENLSLSGLVSSSLIKFNEVDAQGNMYLPDSINIESLNNLKIRGQIKDFEIDENGVKVIKDFRLESGSL